MTEIKVPEPTTGAEFYRALDTLVSHALKKGVESDEIEKALLLVLEFIQE